MLNFNILKHPMNWVTVFLMVLIAGYALDAIIKWEAPK